MSRKDFEYQAGVRISDILLDPSNPRIRSAQSQGECIIRVLRKEKQLISLARSIAENGLTTMPILVTPTTDGQWIVKDGNRRITALKLLNEPALCPDSQVRSQIDAIRKKHTAAIPDKIDCLSSKNLSAIAQEMIARHSGAMGGAGVLDWSAYLRTVYLLNNGHVAEYKRTGQYLTWAEAQNIYVDDDFPITNVSRFFNAENLLSLGFKIENDELIPTISQDKVVRMAARVVDDFGTAKVRLNDIYLPEYAKVYLHQVRNEVGIVDVTANEKKSPPTNTDAADGHTSPSRGGAPPSDGSNSASGDGFPFSDGSGQAEGGGQAAGSGQAEGQFGGAQNSPKRGRPPGSRMSKPAWDRKKIFWTGSQSPKVPLTEIKVATIIGEMKELHTQATPLATTMLLRALIELSDAHYRKVKGIQNKQSLSKNIASSASSMFNLSLIDKPQKELIESYTQSPRSMFHIDTLQRYLHSDVDHPNFQSLHTFWDEIGVFVRTCWIV